MSITTGTTVTFDAFSDTDGSTGPLDLRVIIPKERFLLVAEDSGFYYLQPADALIQHAAAPSETEEEKHVHDNFCLNYGKCSE